MKTKLFFFPSNSLTSQQLALTEENKRHLTLPTLDNNKPVNL